MKKNKKFTPNSIPDYFEKSGRSDEYELIDCSIATDSYAKIDVKHKLCGRVYRISSYDFFHRNRGCRKCVKRYSKYRDNFLETWNNCQRSAEYDLISYDNVINQNSKITVRHKVCQYEYQIICNVFLKNLNNCQRCVGREKRWNLQYFLEHCDSLNIQENYEFVEYPERLNSNSEIIVKHKTCGYTYRTTPSNVLKLHTQSPNRNTCASCAGILKKYTQDNFLNVWDSFEKAKKFILVDFSNVENVKARFTVQCRACGKTYDVNCHKFFNSNNGCPRCSKVEAKYNQENFQKVWDELEHSKDFDLLDFSKVDSAKDYFSIRHKKCGFVFSVNCGNFFRQETGCPLCPRSKGEEKIFKFLKKHKIEHKTQYTFEGCRKEKRLKFDFYIAKVNLLIEYQGSQHYHIMYKKNGATDLAKRQEYDAFKKQCALQAGYDFLEIPYWEFDNIEKILKDKLGL